MASRRPSRSGRGCCTCRAERWEQNVDALRMMMDAQQEQVDIELSSRTS
jgi:hypothetical protein